MRKETLWVYIDMLKLQTDIDSVRTFGSITEMARSGIQVMKSDGKMKKITEAVLRHKIQKSRYWRTDRFLIKECTVERSRNK